MVYPMMDEQLRLEEEMRDATRARYYRLHEKAEERGDLADTHSGRNVFDYVYQPFLDALEQWVAEKQAGRAGKRSHAVRMIEEFNDTRTLAFILTKHLINTTLTLQTRGKFKGARLTRVALVCAQAIHDEFRMRFFADNRKALLKQIVKDFERKDMPRRRRRELMIKQFNTQQLEWKAEGWGQAERLNLGITLLDIFDHIFNYAPNSR